MSSYITIPADFDPAQTLDCGQAFRWHKMTDEGDDCWHGAAKGHVLKLKRNGDTIVFYCTQEEFYSVWRDYFDLNEDYDAKREALSAMSPVLSEAAAFAPGIRILRQEPWEALCSFIISQNNNIPRIQGIIERMCSLCGTEIDGTGLYSFPTAQALAEMTVEELAPLRSGFRAKYLIDAAKKVTAGEIDLKKIAASPVDFGRTELQKILGVGPKVTECTLLYGFHKMECFPIDVWMKRAMAQLLPSFTPKDFGENAGIAQQYIFHYSRMHPELFEEKQ